ncbi:hypothetical protein [Sphingomonas sp. 1P08PE]|uniref:hypothetical protein n=1 Tax=Sphingomonas sp. 1P08PE TaxID=554122 RepID=UPI0039A3134F
MAKAATSVLLGLAMTGLAACHQSPSESAAQTASNGSDGGAATPTNGPGRLRGTLGALDSDTMTITTYDGTSAPVTLDGETKYAWVIKSSLATVKQGDFIGTATTGPDSDLKAVEIVIFPEAMRGTGEGHYGWDTPGVIQAAGQSSGSASSAMTNGTVTQSAMTNGTVSQSAMTNGVVQQSGMTNGTVTADASGAATTKLTVSYKGGTAQVSVPQGTPVVRFEPTEKASLAKGQKLFIKLADDQKTAQFVAIGKDGLTPPM